tara:strand:+ start:273 stop:638 length:366 start_codon:yes stop_codon:yes gene_type:complete
MAKVTESSLDIPAGTNALNRKITEQVIRDPKEHTSYVSVDGKTYIFRTHYMKDRKLIAVPRRNELALFLALREVGLGGSPFPVMDAFKLKIEDADGQEVYPVAIPEEIEEGPNENFSLGDS